MKKSEDRIRVIENIKRNIEHKKFNAKAEEGDPIMTEEQRQEVIMNFDLLRKKTTNKVKRSLIRKKINDYMEEIDEDIELVGLENALAIKGGAIVTSNHFHFFDATITKKMANKTGRKNKFNIVIEETNVLMDGLYGMIFNHFDTLPISSSREYMTKKFFPAVKELIDKNHFVLIYPEQEMWFNYRKPRPLMPGAYHMAVKFDCPILPCFTEIRDKKEYDENGFRKSKYILHIMPAIYPDKNKSAQENKKEMLEKDYQLKVEAYEKAYNKKLDYKFEEKDIAGF